MNKPPNNLIFLNLAKHKLEKSLKQVDNISESIFNTIIFETIIDFYRQEFGFPAATPLDQLIENDPVLPPCHYFDFYEFHTSKDPVTCPVCKNKIEPSRFTFHLYEKCFKEYKNINETLGKSFS